MGKFIEDLNTKIACVYVNRFISILFKKLYIIKP